MTTDEMIDWLSYENGLTNETVLTEARAIAIIAKLRAADELALKIVLGDWARAEALAFAYRAAGKGE